MAPLLLEKKPTILYGLGGLGKSLLSQYLACLVAEGYPVGSLEPEPGRVLYLDYEDDADTMADHVSKIHAGLGVEDKSSIFYLPMGQPLANTLESVHAVVIEKDIQLVVVDSAALAVGSGGAQSDEPVLKYFSALRNLNVTSLTIAHRAKNEDNGPFGSGFWVNVARNVYRVQAEKEGDDRLHMGLFNTKSNDKKGGPFGMRVDFSEDRITFTEENPKARPEMREHLSLSDQLEAILTDANGRPCAVKELAEELGGNSDSIRTTLNRGNQFQKLKDGSWGLATFNGHNITPL